MDDIVAWVSIMLAVASTTLAIAAFVYSWFSYKNATEMNMKTNEILAKITEKVDVVVGQTTGQLDKAWDYFLTGTNPPMKKQDEDISKKFDEISESLLKEAKREVSELFKKAGLEKDRRQLEQLENRVNELLIRTSEKTKEISIEQKFLEELEHFEYALARILRSLGKSPSSKDLYDIIEVLKQSNFPGEYIIDLEQIWEIRNSINIRQAVPKEIIERYLFEMRRLFFIIRNILEIKFKKKGKST